MAPSLIVTIVHAFWSNIVVFYRRALRQLDGGEDVYIFVQPALMSELWSNRRGPVVGIARYGWCDRSDLSTHVLRWLEQDGPRRLCLFNITQAVKAFVASRTP